jgi:hypothetical protein
MSRCSPVRFQTSVRQRWTSSTASRALGREGGEPPRYAGAAAADTRSGGVWTQQGDKLAGTDAVGMAELRNFGLSVGRRQGISRCGDEMMRAMLYEAAQVMLIRTTKWSWLKAWAMKIAKNRGMKKAIVALARRLAVIMHRMWIDGTEFRWTKEVAVA